MSLMGTVSVSAACLKPQNILFLAAMFYALRASGYTGMLMGRTKLRCTTVP
jgi:hypothetical protein